MNRPVLKSECEVGEGAAVDSVEATVKETAPALRRVAGAKAQKVMSALSVAGLGFVNPVIRIAAGEEPRPQLADLWRMLGVPLVAVALFLAAWSAGASQVQTSLGQIPGPAAVWTQFDALIDEHAAMRLKEKEFLARQDARNQQLAAAGRAGEAKSRNFTGKPTYIDQIGTSLKTVFFGFLVATIVALNTGAMEPVDIPNTAWGLLLLGTGTWLISTTHRYKLSGCTSITDMIRGEVARYSLTYTVLQAGIAGLSGKPLAWRRTPKFALKTANDSILATSYYETVLGFVLLLFAMAALLGSDRLGFEFALLIAGSLGTLAFRFLCATYMSALAIDHARRQLGSDQDDPHEAAALAIGEEAAKTRLSTVSS